MQMIPWNINLKNKNQVFLSVLKPFPSPQDSSYYLGGLSGSLFIIYCMLTKTKTFPLLLHENEFITDFRSKPS